MVLMTEPSGLVISLCRPSLSVEGAGGRTLFASTETTIDISGPHALIGANGSGKTTLLRGLAGVIPSRKGSIDVFGCSSSSPLFGYLPAKSGMKEQLSVLENLQLFERLAFRSSDPSFKEWLIESLSIGDLLSRRPGTLSLGQLQRCRLATTLVSQPEMLLMDEPTTGLDIDAAVSINRVLTDIAAQGTGVIIATHDLAQVQYLCSSLSVIHDGEVAYSGCIDKLMQTASASDVGQAWAWLTQACSGVSRGSACAR